MITPHTPKDTISTRSYKYGLIPKGYPPEEAIRELARLNELRNTFITLTKTHEGEYEDLRRASSIFYYEKSDEIEKKDYQIEEAKQEYRYARSKARTRDKNHPLLVEAQNLIDTLKDERRIMYTDIGPLRKEATALVNKDELKALDDKYKNQINEAFRNSQVIKRTADELRKKFRITRSRVIALRKAGQKAELRKKSFDGTGFYYYRFRRNQELADGMNFEELIIGNKPSKAAFKILSIDDSKKKPRLRLRSVVAPQFGNNPKIFQEFDWIYHRPIPKGALIKNAQINRHRIGDRFRYDLVLSVQTPLIKKIKLPHKAIGVDIGFRQHKNSILVATILKMDLKSQKVDGPVKEILIPQKILKAQKHLIELQSELDGAAADLGKALKPILRTAPLDEEHKKYKLWAGVAKLPEFETLSFEKAYKISRWMLWESEALPKDAVEKIKTWWKANSRKYRELHNLRHKALLSRKHFYRQIASDIAQQKTLIVLEKINKTVFAEVRDTPNPLSNKARSQRFDIAPSEFVDAIKNAAEREGIDVKEVDPAYTSKTCSDCGYLFKDLGSEKEWSCSECGVIHDRDENAAKNIANKGKEYFMHSKKKK